MPARARHAADGPRGRDHCRRQLCQPPGAAARAGGRGKRSTLATRRLALAQLTGLGQHACDPKQAPETLKQAGWWPKKLFVPYSDANGWGAPHAVVAAEDDAPRATPPHQHLSLPLHIIFPELVATAQRREDVVSGSCADDEEVAPWAVAATRGDLQSTAKLGWCYVRKLLGPFRSFLVPALLEEAERLHPQWTRGPVSNEFRTKTARPGRTSKERQLALEMRRRVEEGMAALRARQRPFLASYVLPLPRALTLALVRDQNGPTEHDFDRRPRVDPLKDAPAFAEMYCSRLVAVEQGKEPLFAAAGNAALCMSLMLLHNGSSSSWEEAMGWLRRAVEMGSGLASIALHFYYRSHGLEEDAQLWLLHAASLQEPVALAVDAYERAARDVAQDKLSHGVPLPEQHQHSVGKALMSAYRHGRNTLWAMDFFTGASRAGQPSRAPPSRAAQNPLLRQPPNGAAPLPGRPPRCALSDVVGLLTKPRFELRRLLYVRRTLEVQGLSPYEDGMLSPWMGGDEDHCDAERSAALAVLEVGDDTSERVLTTLRGALSCTARLAYRMENWRARDSISAILRPVLEEMEFGAMLDDDGDSLSDDDGDEDDYSGEGMAKRAALAHDDDDGSEDYEDEEDYDEDEEDDEYYDDDDDDGLDAGADDQWYDENGVYVPSAMEIAIAQRLLAKMDAQAAAEGPLDDDLD